MINLENSNFSSIYSISHPDIGNSICLDFFPLKDDQVPEVKKLKKKPSKFERKMGSLSDIPNKVLLAMGTMSGELILVLFENGKGSLTRSLQGGYH
jgi:hypothetical protein